MESFPVQARREGLQEGLEEGIAPPEGGSRRRHDGGRPGTRPAGGLILGDNEDWHEHIKPTWKMVKRGVTWDMEGALILTSFDSRSTA